MPSARIKAQVLSLLPSTAFAHYAVGLPSTPLAHADKLALACDDPLARLSFDCFGWNCIVIGAFGPLSRQSHA